MKIPVKSEHILLPLLHHTQVSLEYITMLDQLVELGMLELGTSDTIFCSWFEASIGEVAFAYKDHSRVWILQEVIEYV